MSTMLDTSYHESPQADDEEFIDEDAIEEPSEREVSGNTHEAIPPKDNASAPLSVPNPEPQNGFVRGLASTLGVGGTLLIAIAKLEEHRLLVTIAPTSHHEDAQGTAVPLQVVGTPEEIDQRMLDELAHYVPARKLVLASGKEVAQLTTKAAQTQRETAGKTAETRKPRSKTTTLTVHAQPVDATLILTDSAGVDHGVRNATAVPLPRGTYTLKVSRDGYEPKTETVLLDATPRDLTITLIESAPSLFSTSGEQ